MVAGKNWNKLSKKALVPRRRDPHFDSNTQKSGESMPLFTVTMKSNRSVNEKDRLSRAIHAASVVAGYAEDDLFQRFLSFDSNDLRVDPYYPALPNPPTVPMLMIDVLLSSLPT